MRKKLEPIFYVYEHFRPDTGDVFYVGKGKGVRAYDFHNRHKHYSAIHAEIEKTGLKIKVRLVATNLTESAAFTLEKECIAFWRELGAPLINMTIGGEGMSGYIATNETRAKHSKITREWQAKLTPEQRSAMARARQATLTPEQKSEIARKRHAVKTPEERAKITSAGREKIASKTPEERSAIVRKGHASRTPDQRSKIIRDWQASKTPEQRSETVRKANAARTPEQRSTAAHKMWATRRAIQSQEEPPCKH